MHSAYGEKVHGSFASLRMTNRLGFVLGAQKSEITMKKLAVVVTAALLLVAAASAQQKKIKVLADQDSAGPNGTNFLSLLMLLRAPQIDLLGITTVSGDQWVEPATVFALWATEQAGRTDVPVVKGAERPLLNTRRELELREALYGSFPSWHGSFNPDAPSPERTWAPPGGYPKVKARPGRAADFIIDTIRANPGEVVLYAAGPLTNIALAVRMDPGIVPLTKAIYIMGGSSEGGIELNWWWDPEAAAIVMREPWKQIVVSPGEAGAQVFSSADLMKRVVRAGGPLANHIRQLYLETQPQPGTTMWSMMWDELTVASMIDPSVITNRRPCIWMSTFLMGGLRAYRCTGRPVTEVPAFCCRTAGPIGGPREMEGSPHSSGAVPSRQRADESRRRASSRIFSWT